MIFMHDRNACHIRIMFLSLYVPLVKNIGKASYTNRRTNLYLWWFDKYREYIWYGNMQIKFDNLLKEYYKLTIWTYTVYVYTLQYELTIWTYTVYVYTLHAVVYTIMVNAFIVEAKFYAPRRPPWSDGFAMCGRTKRSWSRPVAPKRRKAAGKVVETGDDDSVVALAAPETGCSLCC
jgi:hypothetical protein